MRYRHSRLFPTLYRLVLALALFVGPVHAASDTRVTLEDASYIVLVEESESVARSHEIGLGALQKVSGSWRFKDSERFAGTLSRSTWQVVDGYTSMEVFNELSGDLEAADSAELLFACEGRACGHGSQWANRVFGQRLLYGRDDQQRYKVFALQREGREYRVVLYSSARTADRQYLQLDELLLDEPEGSESAAQTQ